MHVWTAGSLVKVRPDDEPGPRVQQVRLFAARGECEAAQLVVHGGVAGVRGLRATAFSFRGASGAPLGQRIDLYRVGYIRVETPSNTEGQAGLWPDPLVPAMDGQVHQRRDAFPVDVPAGKNQPVWVEICAPRKAAPGTYTGRVRLWGVNAPATEVQLALMVRKFAIPATSSLPNTFGFSGRSAALAHTGAMDDAMVDQLTARYARAALEHRVSLHGMSMRPPEVARHPLRVSFDRWDREMAPFLDGTGSPEGARFTAFQLLVPKDVQSDEDLAAYFAAAREHLAARGWLSRAFVYLKDEPSEADFPDIARRAAILHRAAPGLRALVTAPRDPALEGAVDLWTPQLNCFQVVKSSGEFCPRNVPREAYSGAVFWYQACGSHGCETGPTGDARLDGYFTRWPRYVIDAPGAAHRAMAWLAWRYQIQGELHYNTVEAYHLGDPWRSSFAHGGNGDGTLFYPGTPGMIGGTEHVPVESMRLKVIRDGLEDYEYLALLAKLGGAKEADREAARIAPDLRGWEERPERILAARERMAARIESLLARPRPAAAP